MSDTTGPAAPLIPAETIATLISEWRAISDLGATLTEDEWKLPTRLPAWSVQDVLSHLIGTERFLQGLPLAPPRAGGGEPHVRNVIGEVAENEVALRRDRPGAEVLAEWDELRQVREETLSTADAEYFAQPMMTPTGPGTMADFLALRILDCWVHEQDIRQAVGAPGGFDHPAAPHTIDRLIRTIPIVVGKRAACPEGDAVRMVITGAVERDLTYEVVGGRAGLVDTPTRPPVATVTLDAAAFLVLATGRRPATEVDGVVVDAATDEGEALGRRVVDQLNMMI